jgi:hypothetical protein
MKFGALKLRKAIQALTVFFFQISIQFPESLRLEFIRWIFWRENDRPITLFLVPI